MRSLKAALIKLSDQYLRQFPVPQDITLYEAALRLTYSFSSPYSNSKSTFETFHPLKEQIMPSYSDPISQRLKFEEKNQEKKIPSRIQLTDSFQSISNLPHEKLIQDSVFGHARKSQDGKRWVYIAKVKQDKQESIFGGQEIGKGNGKRLFQGDFGEGYQGVTKIGVYVWDLQRKKVYLIETPADTIPACPMFADKEGNKIIVHCYKREDFPSGILHCFNRRVDIYEISYSVQEKEKEVDGKNGKKQKKKEIIAVVGQSKKLQLNQETNIFPNISPCFNYLIFFQGTGITHTYYLDLVIMKLTNGKWEESHRIKEKFIGLYETFFSRFLRDSEGKTFLFTQTLEQSCQRIYQVDLQTGQCTNFTKNTQGSTYAITDCVNNMLLGVYTNHQERSFFYTMPQTFQIKHTETYKNNKCSDISIKEYKQPIHAYLLQINHQNHVDNDFKHNAEKTKRPLIINIHGGPHGSANPVLTLERYLMLKAGYTILMPNATGSAGFGNQYLTSSLGKPGSANATEILNLLDKVLSEHPELSPKRVHLIGGSYGGYMTAYLGCHYPEKFHSGVILNGVLSIPGQLWYTDIPEWSVVEGLGHSKMDELTQEDYIQMFKESPTSSYMKIPTLQLLGAKDRRVPWRQGLLFDALAKKHGTPFETYVYQNSAHSLADSVETTVDVALKILIFYERQNWKEQPEMKQ